MTVLYRFISLFLGAGIAAGVYLIWWWVTPIWRQHIIMGDWNGPVILVLTVWAWFVLSSLLYHKALKPSKEQAP